MSAIKVTTRGLAASLSPYHLAPGMIGEGALTPWLLAAGLDQQGWTQQEEHR